jgi:DNA-binding MarR family transcriptional regulator
MDDAVIGQVRRFNRTVTQRVGALHDHYLARDRPLAEARLLWEIGADGSDVRALRSRLDLDSGYLSRLLRSLESAGLVTVRRNDEDGRVRTAHLTPAGAAERSELDRRSDELARSLLEPLGGAGRDRLVAAMGEVERLLTASLVRFDVVDPSHLDARRCLDRYFAELDRRFDGGFDHTRSLTADLGPFRAPSGAFLIATLRGEPVACGGLRFHRGGPAELKRMWVAASVRGLGVGRRLLAELEARAVAAGGRVVRLETNRALTEAIAMYRSSGYREIPPYNDEPYAHHWFEKTVADGLT